MSSSKPCLVSMPFAFMMFQTSGLNTGKVRLETVILGFACAYAPVPAVEAIAKTAAVVTTRRRDILSIANSPAFSQLYALHSHPDSPAIRPTLDRRRLCLARKARRITTG